MLGTVGAETACAHACRGYARWTSLVVVTSSGFTPLSIIWRVSTIDHTPEIAVFHILTLVETLQDSPSNDSVVENVTSDRPTH